MQYQKCFDWAIYKLKSHEMHLPSFPHTRHTIGMTLCVRFQSKTLTLDVFELPLSFQSY